MINWSFHANCESKKKKKKKRNNKRPRKTSQQHGNNVFVSTRTLKKINILRRREFPKKSAANIPEKKIQRETKKWTLRLIWYIFKNEVDSCPLPCFGFFFFFFLFDSTQCILRKFPRFVSIIPREILELDLG